MLVVVNYIDEVIMLCAGLWMACLGFGIVPAPEAFRGRYVLFFKCAGPALIIISVALAAEKSMRQ